MGTKLGTANLEAGYPTVAEALKHLNFEIRHAKAAGCPVLKIIHGYGSTGTGGKPQPGHYPGDFVEADTYHPPTEYQVLGTMWASSPTFLLKRPG